MMNLTIKGKELSISIKATRELSIEETIAAYQLATGDHEALFIKDQAPAAEAKEPTPDNVLYGIERGTKVMAEILCPFCGFTGKTPTFWGNAFCKCPRCKEPLFLRYATDHAGEENTYGCHYVANEPMKFKNKKDDFAEVFKDEI